MVNPNARGDRVAALPEEEIGTDGGYGPARLVRPDAVRAVAAALDAVDIETLRARFDPAAMTAADIYPGLWADDAHTTNEFDVYLAPNFADTSWTRSRWPVGWTGRPPS